MTTLADLTPAEREQCVGMWCEYRAEDETLRGVLTVSTGHATIYLPSESQKIGIHRIELVTLLPDLPRAWTPEGRPVPGKWEYSNVENIEGPFGIVQKTIITGPLESRRYITEWEEL